MQVLQGKRPIEINKPTVQEVPKAQEIQGEKKTRGRPPHTETRPPTEADKRYGNKTKTTFPRPKGGVRTKDFRAFIRYWKSLTPDMLSRAKIMWYRKWPVINPEIAGAKTRNIALYTDDPNLKTKAACPYSEDNWKEEVLHEFGSGDYKIILCELGVSGAVAECDYISVRDNMIPPRVDIRTLIIGDPLNAGYIQELRQRGTRFPGDPDYKDEDKENESMAQAQAEVIERLTDKLVSMAERPQPIPPTPKRTTDEEASMRTIEMVTKTADRMIEQATTLQTKQQDPIQMMGALSDIIGKMIPNKEGADPMVALLMEQSRRAEERNDALQRELRDREERKAKEEREWRDREEMRHAKEEERREREYKERMEREKPKTLLEQLREKNEIDELMGNKKRSKSGDDDEKEEKEGMMEMVMKNMPLIVSGITTVVALGANAIYNMRLKPGEQPQPVPVQAVQQTQQATAAAASGQTVEQLQAAGVQQEQLNLFLQQIEGPFLTHFFSGELDGHTFANHIVTSHPQNGPMAYMQMKNNGKEILIGVLQNYPPIWMKVGGLAPQLDKFLDEFLEFDEWKASLMAGEDDEEEEEETKVKVN